MHLTRVSVVILLDLATSLGLMALVYAGVTQITRAVPSSVTVQLDLLSKSPTWTKAA